MSVRRLLDPSAATVRCRLKIVGENVWQVWAGDELLGTIEHLDRACWAPLNPEGVRVGAVMPRSKFWAINRLKEDRDRRVCGKVDPDRPPTATPPPEIKSRRTDPTRSDS